jgi:hypothetical protein
MFRDNLGDDPTVGQVQLQWICRTLAIALALDESRVILGPVARAVALALLALVTFNVSGLSTLAGDPPCSEDCPVGVSNRPCSPACNLCGCCSLPKVAQPSPPLSAIVVAVGRSSRPSVDVVPPSPEPSPIPHVPKFLA